MEDLTKITAEVTSAALRMVADKLAQTHDFKQALLELTQIYMPLMATLLVMTMEQKGMSQIESAELIQTGIEAFATTLMHNIEAMTGLNCTVVPTKPTVVAMGEEGQA